MTPSPTVTIDPAAFDAVIFDMDGVITRTARVHAAAWKRMFDAFLEERARQTGESHAPFSVEKDYPRHVDGKPRYDGVRDFLRSREIELPEGGPGDSPDEETVCGLGNRKNRLFLEELETNGVRRYEAGVRLVRRLREAGLGTAIISASENARRVLEAAGVAGLFAVRIDGRDARQMELAGKPAPDVFLAAARKLGCEPGRTAVVEDSRAGVAAARAGGFGLVIGVDRGGQRQALAEAADAVVSDLGEVHVASRREGRPTGGLPSALDRFEELGCRLRNRRPAVFLDYDGTLTPIVERPEEARISAEMRRSVEELGALCPVAIVSGRDRRDVEALAGVEDVIYAGSHGFDIAVPGREGLEFEQGREYLPALDRAEEALKERLAQVDGAQVERKRFAIAVHFRRVAPGERGAVEAAVDAVLAASDGLRKTGGKMIFELRPDIDWDKGRALLWLLDKLDLDRPEVVPVYLGDDLTDEDALGAIEERGIGILVRDEEERTTRARYGLEDVAEVRLFLQRLAGLLEEREGK